MIVAKAEARTLLEARCGVLSDHEVDDLVYRDLKRRGLIGEDPLMALRARIAEKTWIGADDGRDRIVARILDLEDPLVFSLDAGWLVSADHSKPLASFDGRTWTGREVDAGVAGVALTPCAFGFECGKRDLIVAVSCSQDSLCEANRFDLAKARADNEGYDFRTVVDAFHRSVAAVERKDAAAFATRSTGGWSGAKSARRSAWPRRAIARSVRPRGWRAGRAGVSARVVERDRRERR